MRNKVDRIKSEVEKDEFTVMKEVDLTKIVGKGQNNQYISATPANTKSKV